MFDVYVKYVGMFGRYENKFIKYVVPAVDEQIRFVVSKT